MRALICIRTAHTSKGWLPHLYGASLAPCASYRGVCQRRWCFALILPLPNSCFVFALRQQSIGSVTHGRAAEVCTGFWAGCGMCRSSLVFIPAHRLWHARSPRPPAWLAAPLERRNKIWSNPSRLSSRTTANLHQPPFRATAAVCRRWAPLTAETWPIWSDFVRRWQSSYPPLPNSSASQSSGCPK